MYAILIAGQSDSSRTTTGKRSRSSVDRLVDALVVHLDARLRRLAHGGPSRPARSAASPGARLTEESIVLVEAVEDGPRDVGGEAHGRVFPVRSTTIPPPPDLVATVSDLAVHPCDPRPPGDMFLPPCDSVRHPCVSSPSSSSGRAPLARAEPDAGIEPDVPASTAEAPSHGGRVANERRALDDSAAARRGPPRNATAGRLDVHRARARRSLCGRGGRSRRTARRCDDHARAAAARRSERRVDLDVDTLSTSPDGDLEDGLPHSIEELGRAALRPMRRSPSRSGSCDGWVPTESRGSSRSGR